MIKSGSARTLYLDNELWERLLQLVGFSRANNLSGWWISLQQMPWEW